jgi:hypothetical protein
VNLGPGSRREARRLFEQARRAMEAQEQSNIGLPDRIAGLEAHPLMALAPLQNPPPDPTQLTAATFDAIGSRAEINQPCSGQSSFVMCIGGKYGPENIRSVICLYAMAGSRGERALGADHAE